MNKHVIIHKYKNNHRQSHPWKQVSAVVVCPVAKVGARKEEVRTSMTNDDHHFREWLNVIWLCCLERVVRMKHFPFTVKSALYYCGKCQSADQVTSASAFCDSGLRHPVFIWKANWDPGTSSKVNIYSTRTYLKAKNIAVCKNWESATPSTP